MTKEEVKLIVLTTMEEIVLDPLEKSKIATKLDATRYEMSSRRACLRQALLTVILCFTVGIFLSLVCLGAQAHSFQPERPVDANSSTPKLWWEYPFNPPAEKRSP